MTVFTPERVARGGSALSATRNLLNIYGQSHATGQAAVPVEPAVSFEPQTRMFSVGVRLKPNADNNAPLNVNTLGPLVGLAESQSDIVSPPFTASLGETFASGFLDQLRRDYREENEFIAMCTARGGTPIAGLSKGTTPYANLVKALDHAGKTVEGVVCRVTIYDQSESDRNDSRSEYLTKLRQLLNDLEFDVGTELEQTLPMTFMTSQSCAFSHASGTFGGTAVPIGYPELSKLDLEKERANVVVVGPKYWCEFHNGVTEETVPSNDFVHLTARGTRRLGEWYGHVYARHLSGGFRPLRLKSSVVVGNDVLIQFDGVDSALKIDTENVPLSPGLGFSYHGTLDGSPLPAEIELVDSDKVMIRNVPSETALIRFAANLYPSQGSGEMGPRGNLRDATPVTSAGGYPPMYKWACVDELDVTVQDAELLEWLLLRLASLPDPSLLAVVRELISLLLNNEPVDSVLEQLHEALPTIPPLT